MSIYDDKIDKSEDFGYMTYLKETISMWLYYRRRI